MDFKQADEEFKQLKARFEDGGLTEAEFEAQLHDLMVQDKHGCWWMIGSETERWYRYDESSWVQTDRPKSETTESKGREEAVYEAVVGPAVPPIANPRRSLFLIAIAALIVLSIGGYYVLRNGTGSAPGPAPTARNVVPTKIQPPIQASQAPRPTAQPSWTPRPTARPTQTPRPSSIPEPEFRVNSIASRLYLYRGPSMDYPQASESSYPKGTVFTVISRNPAGDWLLCRASNGIEGWLHHQWVDAEFDRLVVPTAATLPPPPPTATHKPKAPKPTPGFGG